ncbi:hypothetical protein [Streptomyces sp. B6B3]|uniref:hypothetical protein n=1 Tax=Streptomyces sp. B6B3 TaxID=3153570 RepID=UPI00325E25F3
MTDVRDSIELWTTRLLELAEGGLDEDEARALVAEIHEAAVSAQEEGLATLEAEREE